MLGSPRCLRDGGTSTMTLEASSTRIRAEAFTTTVDSALLDDRRPLERRARAERVAVEDGDVRIPARVGEVDAADSLPRGPQVGAGAPALVGSRSAGRGPSATTRHETASTGASRTVWP